MHTLLATRCAALAATLALSSALGAQETSPTSMKDPRPVAQAAARRDPIVVDGRLDDAAWAGAKPITDFHQQTPDEGKAPSERTEIRIMYDASAIYIGARMF